MHEVSNQSPNANAQNTSNHCGIPSSTHQTPVASIVNPYISNRRVTPDQATNNAPNNPNTPSSTMASSNHPPGKLSSQTENHHPDNTNDEEDLILTELADNRSPSSKDRSTEAPVPSITTNTTCHWTTIDIPIAKNIGNPISFLFRFIIDILTMGHTVDPTFSFIQALKRPEDIPTIPYLELLNTSTASTDTLDNDRARKYVRKPNVIDPPKTITSKQERPHKILRIEANIATSISINTVLNHLNSQLQPMCGNAKLHPINHSKHAIAGALLYSSHNVNRLELEQALSSKGKPVMIQLENFSKHLHLESHPRLKQIKNCTTIRNILVVYSSPPDVSAVQALLEQLYPAKAQPSYQYPTHRRMHFISKAKLPQQADTLLNLITTQHTFVNQESTWRTSDLLPLASPVQLPSGTTSTVKEILSLLKVPHPQDHQPPEPPAKPLIYDSAQGILDPDSTLLFFAKTTNSRAMSTLMRNLDRALDIEYGLNHNILPQLIRPHALPYDACPNLMLQWQALNAPAPPPPDTSNDTTQGYTTPTSDRPTTPNSYAQAASSGHPINQLQNSLLSNNKKRKAGSPQKQTQRHHDTPPHHNIHSPHQLFFLEQFQDTHSDQSDQAQPNHYAIVSAPPKHMTHNPRPPRNTGQTNPDAFSLQTFFTQQNAMMQSFVDGFRIAQAENSRRFDSIERHINFLSLNSPNQQDTQRTFASHYTESTEEVMEFDYGTHNHLPHPHD